MTERVLIRGARVISVDDTTRQQIPDGSVADILIESGVIEAIGRDLPVRDAALIDASGQIALPGFVDAHRHVWQTQLRAIAGDWTLFEYMVRVRNVYAPRYLAEDAHLGALAGYVEAISTGITTVVDFAHLVTTPEHADAMPDAMEQAKIRGVFCSGFSELPAGREGNWVRAQVESTWRFDDLRRLRAQRLPSNEGLIVLGLGVNDLGDFLPLELLGREIRLGRELGLRRVSLHTSTGVVSQHARLARRLGRAHLLGPDLLFVHGNGWADDEFRAVAASGASLVSTPDAELQMGMGPPVWRRAQRLGIPTGLGADIVSGNSGDFFAAMRLALQSERAAANAALARFGQAPRTLTTSARDVLRAATIGGAQAAGLDHITGSLAVGKAADLLLVRANGLATAPVNDAVGIVVCHATPADIQLVMVAGQILKRDGALVGVDTSGLIRRLETSRDRVLQATDAHAVQALEETIARGFPFRWQGAALARVAGGLLQREVTARLLLRSMIKFAQPPRSGKMEPAVARGEARHGSGASVAVRNA